MTIDRSNYELFIIDFLDGNLTEAQSKALLLFLDENPDIKSEAEGIDQLFLKSEPVIFPSKERLKQIALSDENTFNEKAVAYIEGDLDGSEKSAFDSYIEKDPKAKHAFFLFGLTKLKADTNIVFPDKEVLYRKARLIPIFIRLGQAASIAALLVLAFLLFNPGENSLPVRTENAELAQYQNTELPAEQNNTTETHTNPESDDIQTLQAENTAVPSDSKPVQNKQIAVLTDMNERMTNKDKPDNVEDAILPAPTERDVLEPLKPKKPRKTHYILVVNTTIQNENTLLAQSQKPMDKLAQTGERILASGANINLERKHIEKGILNVLQLASNKRINYETNTNGKVSKINIDADMLAFSLPIRNNKND